MGLQWNQRKPRWNNDPGQWDSQDQVDETYPIGTVYAWYDATQETGYNDGDTVTGMPDQSGNSRNGIYGGQRPSWQDNVQNGEPVYRFDSSNNEWMEIQKGTFGKIDPPVTIFWAGKYNDITQARNFAFDSRTSGLGFWTLAAYDDFHMYNGVYLRGPDRDETFNVWTLYFDSGANSIMRRNGAQVAAGDAGTAGPLEGISFCAADNGNYKTDCDFGELLIYEGLVDFTVNETAMIAKWGVS